MSGCTTSLHGTFVATSYAHVEQRADAEVLGPADGRSCQTRPLYIFASGTPATTHEAIENAKAVHDETSFIADISIDDETRWGFGYSVQCVIVRAIAYR